jgi:DNA-binding sugar fermentation-stimulating protein
MEISPQDLKQLVVWGVVSLVAIICWFVREDVKDIKRRQDMVDKKFSELFEKVQSAQTRISEIQLESANQLRAVAERLSLMEGKHAEQMGQYHLHRRGSDEA